MLLSLVLTLLPLLRNAAQQPSPLHTLVSSSTRGNQLSLEVTPDGKRGFLAEGATIAMLNLETNPPTEIDKQSVPFYQPLALRYYHQATGGGDYLFIAGGAMGVARLTICPNLLQSPPGGCTGGFGLLGIEGQVPASGFERKRCVDVEVLETGTSTGPVLFALFAASSNGLQSVVGPTELHAYTFTSTGSTKIASLQFGSATSPVEVGTALAIDPADNDSIYVALGKGGIRRVDLTLTPQPALTEHAPATWTCGACAGTCPEHVRDITIVQVSSSPSRSVLYAALNYSELLEVDNLGGVSQSCTRVPIGQTTAPARPNGYAERIAAITDNGTSVLIAIATQSTDGKQEDSLGPTNVNGFWSDLCLAPGALDPDDPPISSSHSQVQFYRHDYPSGALSFRSTLDYTANFQAGSLGWNSLILVPSGTTSLTYRAVLCSREVGTEIYDVNKSSGMTTQVGVPFLGEAFGGQDSVASALNSGVIEFLSESTGASKPVPQMMYIDPIAPYGMTPVPSTAWSPCSQGYPTVPLATGCTAQKDIKDPGLFGANIFETAHWVDPTASGSREYFLAGRRILERFKYDSQTNSCNTLTDCSASGPACVSGVPSWWVRKKNFGSATIPIYRTGWRVIRHSIPSSGMPVDGPSLSPSWWEINLPDAPASPGAPAEAAAPGDDRVTTIADPRSASNGAPNVVYVTRSGTSYGFKALRTADIMNRANSSCNPPLGVGEFLQFDQTDYQTILTHLELELNGSSPCVPIAPCPLGPAPGNHQLINNHTCIYQTQNLSGGALYVMAIASGFPASADFPPQQASCQWRAVAGRPMLVLVDITQTGSGSFGLPKVLRIGLGSTPQFPNIQGNALSVRTKTYGATTYAFVGDIMGRVWVFDVTGTKILPSATKPYLPNNAFLKPVASVALPVDPFDGFAANCIDLEVVGTYLYCALGRQGVGIIDISNPLLPSIYDVMDTPGLALGLSTRIVQLTNPPHTETQLIVGDSRCGARVYQ